MVGCYLSSLPKQAMRAIADFTSTAGNFFLARAIMNPPEELQFLVFRDVEKWTKEFEKGKIQQDIAGPNFSTVMRCLKVVLLQDAVTLQNKYPGLTIWNNDLLRSEPFLRYKRQVPESIPPIDESVPISMQVERIVPQISAAIRTSYTSIGSEIRVLKAKMLQNMETYRNDSRRETRQHMVDFFSTRLKLL
ncbi:unnamed protein product [Rhizopus stolonifer]